MAAYRNAIQWVAFEEATADVQPGMDLDAAVDMLAGYMTVTMIADIWDKPARQVAVDVMKDRGFQFPRGFRSVESFAAKD